MNQQQNIVIIKYNAGNAMSLLYALERLGYEATITMDPTSIASADKIIFPGQGEASSAMAYLKEKGLDSVIKNLIQPVLGICLGMHLFAEFSDENFTPCLGIVPADVLKIPPPHKVPHIGWNSIYELHTPLFEKIKNGDYVYFSNSFFIEPIIETIAHTAYHDPFSAAIKKNNFYGVQFHPEKSGIVGEQILKNFIELC